MQGQGRIKQPDWSMFDLTHVVYEPRNFSRRELLDTYWKSFQELPVQAPENFIGTIIDEMSLDTSKESWITKSVNGQCVRKIVFSRYEVWEG
jgi:hypothetical protein